MKALYGYFNLFSLSLGYFVSPYAMSTTFSLQLVVVLVLNQLQQQEQQLCDG
jgi:hypothetical protein